MANPVRAGLLSAAAKREAEVQRIKKVADLMCSGHAILRDRYAFRALLLDIAILTSSTWLTALAFLDAETAHKLTPLQFQPRYWIGGLGVVTFVATILQLRVDWKARSEAHRRSMDLHADVKRASSEALADNAIIPADEFRRVVALQGFASNASLAIPDSQFLALKRHHKLKIAVSRHLDQFPAASVTLTKLKFLWRDNI